MGKRLPGAAVLAAFLLSLAVCEALALPDSEVQRLVRSYPSFARAERRLVSTWVNLPKEFKAYIRAEQIRWIKTVRDQEARMFMDEGVGYVEAYTLVTEARTEYLLEMARPYYGMGGD
ncbi:MAG: hypothetical protein LBW85_09880 [Deltaproteobacteria bacterium]|jgi:hypothetical protein|nr:hypothetical protein [Deltaproteobacteria bacterium]